MVSNRTLVFFHMWVYEKKEDVFMVFCFEANIVGKNKSLALENFKIMHYIQSINIELFKISLQVNCTP